LSKRRGSFHEPLFGKASDGLLQYEAQFITLVLTASIDEISARHMPRTVRRLSYDNFLVRCYASCCRYNESASCPIRAT
jgi:hypothetical protein